MEKYKKIAYGCIAALTVTLCSFEPISVQAETPKPLIDYDFEQRYDPNPESNDPLYGSNGAHTVNETDCVVSDEEVTQLVKDLVGELGFTDEELEEFGISGDIDINSAKEIIEMFGLNEEPWFSTFAAGGDDGYKEVVFGVDVSRWQGDINWSNAKASGVQFALIRATATGLTDGIIYDDSKADFNIVNAADNGIQVGLYAFSQATTVAEAQAEADRLIQWANKYRSRISLPLVIDYEYGDGHSGKLAAAHLSKDQQAACINAFCARVREAGYTPMLYANKDMLLYDINTAAVEAAGNDVWLARWTQNSGVPSGGWTGATTLTSGVGSNPNATVYNGNYEFWQFTSMGNGSHFGMGSSYVDLNFWYRGVSAKLEFELPLNITVKGGESVMTPCKRSGYDPGNTIWNQAAKVDGINQPVTYTVEYGRREVIDGVDYYTDYHTVKCNINDTSARQFKVYITNGYLIDEYALVYDLTYNAGDNTYSATFNHVEDYVARITDIPDGYDDNHVTFTNSKGNIVGTEESLAKKDVEGYYQVGVGRDAAYAYLYIKDGSTIKYTAGYKLTYNESTHSYDVAFEYDNKDTTIAVTPKAGYTDKKIWFDGIAYTATEKDGKWEYKWDANKTAPKTATIYSYNDSGSPKGMMVYFINADEKGYHVEEMTALENLLGYGGYSMRVTGTNGMRYRASIPTTKADTLRTTGTNGYKLTEYGIAVMSGNNYDSGLPIVLDDSVNGGKVSTSKAFYRVNETSTKTALFAKESGMNYFSAVFVNMPVNRYKTKMFGRAYAIFEKDGVKYYIYNAPYGKDIYTLAGQVLDAKEFPETKYPNENAYIQSIRDAADALETQAE